MVWDCESSSRCLFSLFVSSALHRHLSTPKIQKLVSLSLAMFSGLKLSKGSASANSQNGNSNAFQTGSNSKTKSSIFSWKTVINQNVTYPGHHERLPAYPPSEPAMATIALPPITTGLPPRDPALSSRMVSVVDEAQRSTAERKFPSRSRIGSSYQHNENIDDQDQPITPESIYSREALTTGSILKDGGFPRLKGNRMKIYLPPSTQPEILAYMTSPILGDSTLIPLWSPPPTLQRGAVRRTKRIAVGDVGHFDGSGGFRVMFNIFWDQQANMDCGFVTPPGFKKFVAPQSLLFRSYSQPMGVNGTKTGHSVSQDDTLSSLRVDSDDSSIIQTQTFKEVNEDVVVKMRVDIESTNDEVIYSLSPKSKLAVFLYFPQGATTYELEGSVNMALQHYLTANAEQWCQHFDRLGILSRMVFVRSVVLAKSFASAVFRGSPNSSSSAQLRISTKDSSLRWSRVSKGFVKTIVSGQQEAVREQGGSSPMVDDQCAALEGLEVTATASVSFGIPRQSFQTFRLR
ncbi:hypothetical protein CPB83DRAFT_903276 [Crepidotus variabilis]|uniref:Uncharacterized protein n=1 Tax=Crepidotus variabilis TaxID=179855 RepID=A0A9P6JUD6_9AGAR|nr:hypothetical protein CPB83DRAFT_903276 [Crepidotus variabilis]